MVSAHHVIFKPHASVECADRKATRSITGTIESCPFKTFICDDVTVPNLCLCVDVTVPRLERIAGPSI